MSSNFEKVIEFSNTSNIPHHETPQLNIFNEDPAKVKYRLSLIEEEVQELRDAIQEKNFTEVIDALSDILYVVYGAGSSFGIDLNKTFDIVHKSNMSKFCKSEKEAQETVEWYKKNDSRYDFPAYRKSTTCENLWVVYNRTTQKILKSINYTPAKFN